MTKYELSLIGAFHTNHNEDASAVVEIDNERVLVAVMDGCSMGKESHFISTLIAKLLRRIGKEIHYRSFIEKTKGSNSKCLKDILQELFLGLGEIKNKLLLEEEEVLSTLIIGVLDKKERTVNLLIIGDGLVCCNGTLYEFEQDDKPDYLGYHLLEDFEKWFQQQTQYLILTQVADLSITTDGIFTFKNFDGQLYPKITQREITEDLLLDRKWADQENMLKKKVLEIEKQFGLKPGDDLTVVRMMI